MTTLVQLDGAARWFGAGHTEVVALHPTDLSVAGGELIAVMGPSRFGEDHTALPGRRARPAEPGSRARGEPGRGSHECS